MQAEEALQDRQQMIDDLRAARLELERMEADVRRRERRRDRRLLLTAQSGEGDIEGAMERYRADTMEIACMQAELRSLAGKAEWLAVTLVGTEARRLT